MNNQWLDNLRNRMEKHQEPSPEGLWNDIEQILKAKNVAKEIPLGKTILLWTKRVGAAAGAVILLFFIGQFILKENQKNTQFSGQIQREHPTFPSFPSHEKETVVKAEKEHFAHHSRTAKSASKQSSHSSKTSPSEQIMEQNGKPTHQELEKQQSENEIIVSDESKNHDSNNNNQGFPNLETENTASNFNLPMHTKRKYIKWHTDIYAANIPSGVTHTHNGYDSFSPFESPRKGEEYILANIRPNFPNDIQPRNEYEHTYTEIKHLQPLTLGISMKYNLDKRWSLASGLTYSILLSEMHSGKSNRYYNSKQTLHYIGIPINLNYTVWRNRKVLTYISAGGLVEKNISGKLSTNYFIDNKIEHATQEKISTNQLQWSVNSAIGIQYNIADNVAIYTEPGMAYYFKNNSDLETIYKQKSLIFNIRLGMRFSINKQ